MVQLYWNSTTNTPARNNPWYDSVTTHPYNVGYQFNHDAPATRYFVSRVVNHWLNDYKIDGFRFDLSKGFTQTVTVNLPDAVTAWGHYDTDRVAIWKQYYDTLQLKSAGSYCILEHFADNDEETVLSNYGMMLWGNENSSYNQATMGYSTNPSWDFSYGLASARGWTNPYLVTYAESHDEERLMYKNIQYGNSSGSYSIKDTATALKREELAAAFLLTQPGPKMIWQFGELGYDYSINTCGDLTVNNCRTGPKPIRWDYLQQTNRKKLHDVYSALIKLRFNSSFADEFISNTSQQNFSGSFKWLTLNKIVVVGNFDVTTQSGSVTFPATGTWYDYLNGTTRVVSNVTQSFTLLPGEYHVFTRTAVALPVTIVNFSGKEESIGNVLSWNVANELNLSHYELEKSTDGQNFSFVAKINADERKNYSYTDDDVENSPVNYYRLKSVDMDGNFNYSGIVKIKTKNATLWSAEVSPNPVSEKIYLKIESPAQDKATVIITDLSGRRLYKENISISDGNNSFEINKSANFSNGTYFISIFSTQQTKTIKVIKNK